MTDKSVWVRVSNEGSSAVVSPEVARLSERLWNCIRLSGSRKLAHYRLAKLYLESGDRESAITHLEATVAYDPSFVDARKLLNDLRGWKPVYIEVKKGSPGSKMVALTFDDGPNERTAEMLEVLSKLNVPATFFLVGFRAQLQPELVKALASAGHEIENHSYTHTNLTTLTADQVEVELSRGAAAIHAITGRSPRYFRPPGGHANDAVKQAAARQGFTGVLWTVLCSPYEGAKYESLSQSMIKAASDGAIILMHNGEPATTSALPEIVAALRARGYRFVTLSELLASR
jgi:peptidoglycan/xylan/chitin deacetylase (PgdA/CDA1 family)